MNESERTQIRERARKAGSNTGGGFVPVADVLALDAALTEAEAALRVIEENLNECSHIRNSEDEERIAFSWRCARAKRVVRTDLCPEHRIPDCSPLLNGCSLLTRVGSSAEASS